MIVLRLIEMVFQEKGARQEYIPNWQDNASPQSVSTHTECKSLHTSPYKRVQHERYQHAGLHRCV